MHVVQGSHVAGIVVVMWPWCGAFVCVNCGVKLRTDTSDAGHFGTRAKLSARHFGTGPEVCRHFGTTLRKIVLHLRISKLLLLM